jgi:hypothetical protein
MLTVTASAVPFLGIVPFSVTLQAQTNEPADTCIWTKNGAVLSTGDTVSDTVSDVGSTTYSVIAMKSGGSAADATPGQPEYAQGTVLVEGSAADSGGGGGGSNG